MTTPAATLFIETYIKLFFLLTPFFVLSAFLSMTRSMDMRARRILALRVMAAVAVSGCVLSLAGNMIFSLFGITLDAFRVGAGALLFLSAVGLVRGGKVETPADDGGDISVVPLAIPITIGPATVGALLVMGAQLETPWERAVELSAFLAASLSVGLMLLAATSIEKLVGRMGLTILSKLTGLILAALSAQIIFTGIRGLMAPLP